MKLLRAVLLCAATVLWFGICSALCVTGLLELWYPNQPRYANGVLVFYLGIERVGFPLATVAFYAVSALSPDASATADIWVSFVTVLLVGGVQWLVLVPALVRFIVNGRDQTVTSLWHG